MNKCLLSVSVISLTSANDSLTSANDYPIQNKMKVFFDSK
jgi:hypothetical protein